MQRILKNAALAAAAVLTTGAMTAQAGTVALYDFEEFTGASATTWPATAGPWADDAGDTEATATSLSHTGLSFLEANHVRNGTSTNWTSLPSDALLLGLGSTAAPATGSNLPPAPTSTTDYLAFSVTAAQDNLEVNSFSFDLGLFMDANTNSAGPPAFTTNETHAQLFYSTDGTNFTAVGPLQQRVADNADNLGVWTGMQGHSIDLSGVPEIDSGQTLHFRLGISDNRGTGTDNAGSYWDNLALNATVVPEPGSLALAGITGLGLLARRRRHA